MSVVNIVEACFWCLAAFARGVVGAHSCSSLCCSELVCTTTSCGGGGWSRRRFFVVSVCVCGVMCNRVSGVPLFASDIYSLYVYCFVCLAFCVPRSGGFIDLRVDFVWFLLLIERLTCMYSGMRARFGVGRFFFFGQLVPT